MSSGLIKVTSVGKLKKTSDFLNKASHFTDHIEDKLLTGYAMDGVRRLADATPKKTGKTAASWTYEIKRTKSGASIEFNNTNINDGVNIALILEYGHGTGTGGYVRGLNYIEPVLAEEFKKFADGVFMEVKGL